MRLVVVDFRSATGRVAAVYAVLHRASAADRLSEVVDGRVTATSVGVVGLGSDDTVAADVGLIVVGVVSTAAGVPVEALSFQLSTAADVVVAVIHLTVAAAVRAGSVDLRSATARIHAVDLEARNIAGAAEMIPGTVHESAAAASVVRYQGLDATATHAVAPVIHHSIAAA